MANMSATKIPAEGLDGFDYFRSGAMIVGFLCSVSNQKNWLRAESLVCMVTAALCLLMPIVILHMRVSTTWLQVAEVTPFQMLMSQMISCLVLAHAWSSWRVWRHSLDDTVTFSVLFAQFVRTSLLLLTSYYYIGKFREEHQYFYMLLVGVVWLGSLYHIVTNRSPLSGRIQMTVTNYLLAADFLVCFVTGVAHFGFPDLIIEFHSMPSGPMTYFLVRCAGALHLGRSMMVLASMAFRYEEDQNEMFASRILSLLLMMVFALYATIFRGDGLPPRAIHMVILPFILHGIFPALGIIAAYRKQRSESEIDGEYFHYTRSKGKVM